MPGEFLPLRKSAAKVCPGRATILGRVEASAGVADRGLQTLHQRQCGVAAIRQIQRECRAGERERKQSRLRHVAEHLQRGQKGFARFSNAFRRQLEAFAGDTSGMTH